MDAPLGVALGVATLSLLCTALHHLLPALAVGNVIHLVTLPDGGVELRMRCTPAILTMLHLAVHDKAMTMHHRHDDKPASFADMADHLETERQALAVRARSRPRPPLQAVG